MSLGPPLNLQLVTKILDRYKNGLHVYALVIFADAEVFIRVLFSANAHDLPHASQDVVCLTREGMSGRSSRQSARKEKHFEEFEEMAQHSGDPLLVNFERVRGGT